MNIYIVKEEAKLADLILIIIKHVLYTNCSWKVSCSVNSAGTVLDKQSLIINYNTTGHETKRLRRGPEF